MRVMLFGVEPCADSVGVQCQPLVLDRGVGEVLLCLGIHLDQTGDKVFLGFLPHGLRLDFLHAGEEGDIAFVGFLGRPTNC